MTRSRARSSRCLHRLSEHLSWCALTLRIIDPHNTQAMATCSESVGDLEDAVGSDDEHVLERRPRIASVMPKRAHRPPEPQPEKGVFLPVCACACVRTG